MHGFSMTGEKQLDKRLFKIFQNSTLRLGNNIYSISENKFGIKINQRLNTQIILFFFLRFLLLYDLQSQWQ